VLIWALQAIPQPKDQIPAETTFWDKRDPPMTHAEDQLKTMLWSLWSAKNVNESFHSFTSPLIMSDLWYQSEYLKFISEWT